MSMRTGEIEIALSTLRLRSKIPPGHRLWGEFNDSFENRTLTLEDVAEQVYEGRAWTVWHAHKRLPKPDGSLSRYRTSGNFISGQVVGLDFEHSPKCTLEALQRDPFLAKYAALLYTTPSHDPPADPRARALFVLERPLTKPEQIVRSAKALLFYFEHEADPACKDPVRFYYGSPFCDMVLLDHTLPIDVLAELVHTAEAALPPPKAYTPTQVDGESRLRTLVNRVLAAGQGSRNVTLNQQAFYAGLDVARGVLDPARAHEALTQAGLQIGLGATEVHGTVRRGLQDGMAQG